jgi:integrase
MSWNHKASEDIIEAQRIWHHNGTMTEDAKPRSTLAPHRERGKALTDAILRTAKRGDIHREEGLEFRFFRNGQAGVRYVGRLGGTNARLALPLGRYPELSLKAARVAADKARADCKRGLDPRHALLVQAKTQELRIGQLLEEYLSNQQHNRPTTRKDKTNTLRPALASWKKRPIGTVTKGDVARLLDKYNDRPATKRKLYAYLNHFFEWTIERDLIETNPCYRLRTPKAVPKRTRVLSNHEIKALMGLSGSTWGRMLQISLLTGQRGIEVCKMRRSEISPHERTWRIPPETLKQGRLHVVPLSETALGIILQEMAQRQDGWGDYIFGVGSNGQKAYDGRSNGMKEVLRLTGTSGWSGHTCRHTAITLLQKLGVTREVRRAVTGQGQPRDGASAYEHYGYAKEALEAVERLAAEINSIKSMPDSHFEIDGD